MNLTHKIRFSDRECYWHRMTVAQTYFEINNSNDQVDLSVYSVKCDMYVIPGAKSPGVQGCGFLEAAPLL